MPTEINLEEIGDALHKAQHILQQDIGVSLLLLEEARQLSELTHPERLAKREKGEASLYEHEVEDILSKEEDILQKIASKREQVNSIINKIYPSLLTSVRAADPQANFLLADAIFMKVLPEEILKEYDSHQVIDMLKIAANSDAVSVETRINANDILAVIYRVGRLGIEIDLQETYRLKEKVFSLAGENAGKILTEMGLMTEYGVGCEADPVKAYLLYYKKIEEILEEGKFSPFHPHFSLYPDLGIVLKLAYIYQKGIGTDINQKKADHYFSFFSKNPEFIQKAISSLKFDYGYVQLTENHPDLLNIENTFLKQRLNKNKKADETHNRNTEPAEQAVVAGGVEAAGRIGLGAWYLINQFSSFSSAPSMQLSNEDPLLVTSTQKTPVFEAPSLAMIAASVTCTAGILTLLYFYLAGHSAKKNAVENPPSHPEDAQVNRKPRKAEENIDQPSP